MQSTRGVGVWCTVAHTYNVLYNHAKIHIASIEYFMREPSILRYIVIYCTRKGGHNSEFATPFVSTGAEYANIFTKTSFKLCLEELRNKLGLSDSYVLVRGGVLVLEPNPTIKF